MLYLTSAIKILSSATATATATTLTLFSVLTLFALLN